MYCRIDIDILVISLDQSINFRIFRKMNTSCYFFFVFKHVLHVIHSIIHIFCLCTHNLKPYLRRLWDPPNGPKFRAFSHFYMTYLKSKKNLVFQLFWVFRRGWWWTPVPNRVNLLLLALHWMLTEGRKDEHCTLYKQNIKHLIT